MREEEEQPIPASIRWSGLAEAESTARVDAVARTTNAREAWVLGGTWKGKGRGPRQRGRSGWEAVARTLNARVARVLGGTHIRGGGRTALPCDVREDNKPNWYQLPDATNVTHQAEQQLLGEDERWLYKEKEQRAPLPAGAVAHVTAGRMTKKDMVSGVQAVPGPRPQRTTHTAATAADLLTLSYPSS